MSAYPDVDRGMRFSEILGKTRRFGIADSLAERAFREGWDDAKIADYCAARLNATAPNGDSIAPPAGTINGTVLERALMLRCNLRVPDDVHTDTAYKHLRSVSLRDVCEMAIGLEFGGSTRMYNPEQLFARAASTVLAPQLFSAVANKMLLTGFQYADQTGWMGVREVKDLKQVTEVGLGPAGELQKVNSGGEVKHDKIDREWYANYQAQTYASALILTRADILNDDIGALQERPREMGMSASATLNRAAYTMLLSNSGVGPTLAGDATALFHANHSNLTTGGTSALSTTSIKTVVAKLRNQKHYDGQRRLSLSPAWLIVPPELEWTARELLQSALLVIAGTSGSVTERAQENVLAGLANLVVASEINDTTIGGNTTQWFLACSAREAPSLVKVFLQGKQAPSFQQMPQTTQLQLKYEIVFDFGVAAIDFRGIQRADGA